LEASLGFRVFDFRDRRTVKLLTGSAAMYVGSMWFSVRPYISVDLPRTAFSVMATGRYYYGERDEFAFVRLGAGFTPDERTSLTTSGLPATEVFTLHSQTLGLGGQWLAGSGLLLTIEATYGRQEVGFRRGTYISSSSVILGARHTVR
jgi:YaiO family outer membrane protein